MLVATCPEMEGRQILKNLIGEFLVQRLNLDAHESDRRGAKNKMCEKLNNLRMLIDKAANDNQRRRNELIKKNELEQLLMECSKEIRDLVMKIDSVDRQIDFLQCSWANWGSKLDELDQNWRRQYETGVK